MTSGASPVAAEDRRIRPRGIALLAGAPMFALTALTPTVLNDGDTLWQIRAGEWILDHRAIPSADPFAYTTAGLHWFAHEWLSETLLALAFRLAGFDGVMLLGAVAAGLTAALLAAALLRVLPLHWALTGLVVAMANTLPALLVRPHLLAWPLLTLWSGGLVAARARGTAPSWALLPVMLAWVNMHGSFMFGLLLAGWLMLEALLDAGANRPRVLLQWGGFTLAAWAVALLNPDGVGGVLFPFHVLGIRNLAAVPEWRPLDFAHPHPVLYVVYGALLLGLSGRVRVPLPRVLLFVGLVHATLMLVRNETLLGIVGTLALATPIGPQAAPAAAPRRCAWCGPAAALLCAVTVTLRLAAPVDVRARSLATLALVEHLPASVRATPVLNAYEYGGVLIFDGLRPFIDSRADLYGDGMLDRYWAVTTQRAALERALADYRVGWTMFAEGSDAAAMMGSEPGWEVLARDGGAVVHARTSPAPSGTAPR